MIGLGKVEKIGFSIYAILSYTPQLPPDTIFGKV
jgi:hypothetical protein